MLLINKLYAYNIFLILIVFMDILKIITSSKRQAWTDLAWVFIASVATWLIAGNLDLAERWINWAALGEHFQLDEIIFVLLTCCSGLMWFGHRRFAELERVHKQNLSIQSSLEKKHKEASLLLQQNRSLIKHITFLREAERNQLAGELHDVFGQYLAAIDVNTTVGLNKLDPGNEICRILLTIQDSARFLRNVTRSKLRSIKPPGLEKVGLTASLNDLITQWQDSFSDFELNSHIDIEDSLINYDTALTIYRCLQEGLVNISRHSGARHIMLEIAFSNHSSQTELNTISLTLQDDGIGFSTDEKLGQGMGLIGVRERVTSLNGDFQIDSSPHHGTMITIHIPLTNIPETEQATTL